MTTTSGHNLTYQDHIGEQVIYFSKILPNRWNQNCTDVIIGNGSFIILWFTNQDGHHSSTSLLKTKLSLLLSKPTVPFESKIDWSVHWIVLYNMYVFIVLVAKPRWPPLLDIDLK